MIDMKMEPLDEFLNEEYRVTNQQRLDGILEDFGINPDEVYHESLRDSIYRMAAEIYNHRRRKYVDTGHVRPN